MKKKIATLGTITFLAFFNLSLTSTSPEFGLLEKIDWEIFHSQKGPTLQSPIGVTPHQESYSEWKCFKGKPIRIFCQAIDSHEYTSLEIERDGHFYTFDSPSFEECQNVKEEWEELLKNQNEFCMFAAKDIFVENKYNEPFSFWAAYGIKTRLGRSMAPIFDLEEEESDFGILDSRDKIEEGTWECYAEWRLHAWCFESLDGLSQLIVEVDFDNSVDKYKFGNRVSLDDCQGLKEQIDPLFDKTHRFCIAGKYVGSGHPDWEGEPTDGRNFELEKIKTKNGVFDPKNFLRALQF